MAACQKSVGIHSVRRAGHQGAVVFSLFELQVVELVRQHDVDLVDLISQYFIQRPQHEGVAFLHLIQVREQACAGETAVTGQDTVAALSPDGKRTARDMSDRDLQDRVVGTVVDGQEAIDLLDLDISHDPGAGDVQLPFIVRGLRRVELPEDAACSDPAVILPGALEHLIIEFIADVCDAVRIVCDGPGLMEAVPVVADTGIQHQGQPGKEDQD